MDIDLDQTFFHCEFLFLLSRLKLNFFCANLDINISLRPFSADPCYPWVDISTWQIRYINKFVHLVYFYLHEVLSSRAKHKDFLHFIRIVCMYVNVHAYVFRYAFEHSHIKGLIVKNI